MAEAKKPNPKPEPKDPKVDAPEVEKAEEPKDPKAEKRKAVQALAEKRGFVTSADVARVVDE